MKWMMGFLMLAAAVALAIPAYRLSAAPAPAAGRAFHGPRWEYAQLRMGDFINGDHFSFAGPDDYVEDRTSPGLLRKLEGKPEEKEVGRIATDSGQTQLAIFNQLGADGWELVTVAPEGVWGSSKALEADYTNYSGSSRTYLFKRPARTPAAAGEFPAPQAK